MISNNCPLWRIALSEVALTKGFLFLRGIPSPSTAPFKDFAATFSNSKGGAKQHGYASVTLTWTELLTSHAWFLNNYVTNALAGSGLLYLTISKNNAKGIGRHWIDCSGIPLPTDITEGGIIVGSQGMYYQNVTLTVNNLTIINDPAIF